MRFLAAILILAGITAIQAETMQERRWRAASVSLNRFAEAGRVVSRIESNRQRYQAVESKTSVPWHVIAGLHNMEASGSFRHHLHEGSPLSGRTRWAPKGRPKTGVPPFTWEVSAADALLFDRMNAVDWKSLEATLYACERYNGVGYLKYHPETPTPYLWAGTSIERPGKYVADGKWSSTARSNQIGIAAIWKIMESRRVLKIPNR